MSLKAEIIRALREEGYRINETITDALDEFIEMVEDENETIDDHFDDGKEDEADD
ncbi:MAG: hypothetical protein ACOCZK_04865 [Planctomycetota bacterium]